LLVAFVAVLILALHINKKQTDMNDSLGSTSVPITTVSETSFLGFLHEFTLGFPACSRRANPGHLINTQQF
jgi:hypothetical protein